MLIVSKTFTTPGIGPPGRFGFVAQRVDISLQPPHDGTTPTPTSTRPM